MRPGLWQVQYSGEPTSRLDSPTAAASSDLPRQAIRRPVIHNPVERPRPVSPHLAHRMWIAGGTSRSERPFRPPCRPPVLRTYVLSCLHIALLPALHRPLSTPLRTRAATDLLGPNGLVLLWPVSFWVVPFWVVPFWRLRYGRAAKRRRSDGHGRRERTPSATEPGGRGVRARRDDALRERDRGGERDHRRGRLLSRIARQDLPRRARACFQHGHPVDAITVADKLDETGELAEIGGPERIREIATLVAGHLEQREATTRGSSARWRRCVA